MKIDTGERFIDVTAQSAAVDDTQFIKITCRTRATRLTTKIAEAIQAHECPDQLDDYWRREDQILDALHLFDQHAAAYLADIYQEHRAALIYGGAYQSAQAVPHRTESGNPTAQDGKDDKGTNDDFFF